MPSAAVASSPAASAPRSSRSSIRPPRALACATTKPPAAGFDPVTIGYEADDHKACYPAATESRCASPETGPPAGCWACSYSAHRHAEIAKRIDIAATASFHGMTIDAFSDLDLWTALGLVETPAL
jgi:hypothetical protein